MNQSLARRALRGALETRKKAGVGLTSPLCIYDIASEKLKVEIRFQSGASFGGMYAKETQTILVPSERPAGRRAFTCAHELGHWFFGHGSKVEELSAQASGELDDEEETLANQFAGHLLMPKWAMEKAFRDRQLRPAQASEESVYALACQFGVGYQTVLTHLTHGLAMLPRAQADRLLESTPKLIRQRLLGRAFLPHLVYVDRYWDAAIPIDLEVGDAALLTFPARVEDSKLAPENFGGGTLFVATTPGISKVSSADDQWASFVRIARRGFTGRSIYRHLEDPDV